MDENVFNKIVHKAVKKSPETLNFLMGQAQEIFEIELQDWKKHNNEKDFNQEYILEQAFAPALKKFDKYIISWFLGVRENINIRLFHETMPYEINMIFEHFLDEIMDKINLYDISEEIMDCVFSKFKDKQNLEK